MPRRARETLPPATPPAAGQTVFGIPWSLPLSPTVVGLLFLLVVAAGTAWLLEGRYQTPPAEAAKLLVPYKADDLQQVVLTLPGGSATFTRSGSGKLTPGGVEPQPTPTPTLEATPGPVQLAPSTRLEGLINQLHDLRIGRVIVPEASSSAEFGLDQPRLVLALTPRRGAPSTIAVGQLTPDQSAYYVRREGQQDTVLASKYTLDDLIKVAGELVSTQPGTPTGAG